MNRSQHLTASQPRPKRRAARPGASSLCFVPNTASAANDHHMGPGNDPPEATSGGDTPRAINRWSSSPSMRNRLDKAMIEGRLPTPARESVDVFLPTCPPREVKGRYCNNASTFYGHKTLATLNLESRRGERVMAALGHDSPANGIDRIFGPPRGPSNDLFGGRTAVIAAALSARYFADNCQAFFVSEVKDIHPAVNGTTAEISNDGQRGAV